MQQSKGKCPNMVGVLSGVALSLAVLSPLQAGELKEEAAVPFDRSHTVDQVPFGETMKPVVENYGRPAPYVASGGMITDEAMDYFSERGFRTVVSLLNPGEGIEAHREQAQEAGIEYYNFGVTSEGPGEEQVEGLREVLADPDNYPVMIHCASANRVGSLWARYRIEMGVPTEVAFQEARAVGLGDELEQTLRERMGL